MKPVLEYLPRESGESFVARYFDYSYYPTPWHYHPEYELVLVTASTGKRFIGDNICDFAPGNLALIGPNLPHLYRNDEAYYHQASKRRAQSIVIHFLPSSLGDDFLQLPETKRIRNLLNRSAHGLNITGKTNKIVAVLLHELLEQKNIRRWMKLVEILVLLSESKDYRLISHSAVTGQNDKEADRLSKVFEFVLQHFASEIRITEVASLVHMANNSFSRYFRERTRKTFSAFVSEIRLSHACKLLIENQKSVTEICYECGFNNLSNFNRQFRGLYHTNPMEYRKQYVHKEHIMQ